MEKEGSIPQRNYLNNSAVDLSAVQIKRVGNIIELAQQKGEMTYVFKYTMDKSTELLRQLGKMASDKTNTFTWYDAAIVSQSVNKIRKQIENGN